MHMGEAVKVDRDWQEALRYFGYDHATEQRSVKSWKKWPRSWRRILRHMQLRADALEAFEFGCGGARHLATLALNGWKCLGIDISGEVLERAGHFIKVLSEQCGYSLPVEFHCGDFSDYHTDRRFNLVFHWGVLEHIMREPDRIALLRKMFDLASSDGYVVSVVPNGIHPLRDLQRRQGLGGYVIPEIDYDGGSLMREMIACGGRDVIVLPHNVFGYLPIVRKSRFDAMARRLIYYLWQVVPQSLLPCEFALRHCYWLIAIARKGGGSNKE
jgi:2-polyprenyl-3-methyl-5-hydroxy-6-metoxy-1,4-benzoquinol methylase